MAVRDGPSDELTTDERLNLHFLKNAKTAVLRDPTDEQAYSIPYGSSVKFGVIYTPAPDDENAPSPYLQLRSAGDVMKLKQLPLVVAAMEGYDGGSPTRSVSEGEVLFVTGTRGGGIGKARQLEAVSVSSREEKILLAKCTGSFSTDPRHTRLHLSQLLLGDLTLPQYVILYADKEVNRSLLPSMSNAPLILEEVKGETSVIATRGDVSDIDTGEWLVVSRSGGPECNYYNFSKFKTGITVAETCL